MPSNDREVFDYLTAEADVGKQERQIAFLAYAQFAFEKREWIDLYRSRHNNAEPTQAAIDDWIANLTDSQFTTWRGAAERFFVDAADAYFQDRLIEERAEILRSTIVAEVKAAGSFGRQFGIALATAILAPLIIGGIIAAALIYDKTMFTGSSVAGRVGTETDGSTGLPMLPPKSR